MKTFGKRIGSLFLVSAIMASALTGCGGSDSGTSADESASGNASDTPHITVVLKTLASEYWLRAGRRGFGCNHRSAGRVL